jgi:ABC-type Fe3+-hydroxamate transport system substrate-binding protein
MTPPSRRRVLRSGWTAVTLVVTGGCVSRDDGNGAPSGTTDGSPVSTSPPTTTSPSPQSTETPSAAERIVIVLFNETSTRATVRLTVRGDGGAVRESTVEVPPEGDVSVRSGIDEPGTYRISVAVADRPVASATFAIDGYDVRMGSNVIVTVGADEVDFTIEE